MKRISLLIALLIVAVSFMAATPVFAQAETPDFVVPQNPFYDPATDGVENGSPADPSDQPDHVVPQNPYGTPGKSENAGNPATPATPAVPAVPAHKTEDGVAVPAIPAVPAVPAQPAKAQSAEAAQPVQTIESAAPASDQAAQSAIAAPAAVYQAAPAYRLYTVSAQAEKALESDSLFQGAGSSIFLRLRLVTISVFPQYQIASSVCECAK